MGQLPFGWTVKIKNRLDKINIRKLDKEELIKEVEALGQKKFRAKQIYEWLWKKGACSFEEMTNLSVSFRSQLEEVFFLEGIVADKIQRSIDGTIKFRFKLQDGNLIESVLIPVEKDKRFTVCVSSQVGCSLSCKFCATGQMKRMRNLEVSEIYDQVVAVDRECQKVFGFGLTNIVYMGMGEPLLNYKNMIGSIRKISSEEGLGMSPRRITVSTVGISKMIYKLAEEGLKINLALSLHAADDIKRSEIMPINDQNDLASLMEALKYFHQINHTKISYEYIAFQHFNDGLDDADQLSKLCSIFPVTVNIIEYNPIDNVSYVKSDEDKINIFAKRLRDKGTMVTLRRSRGKDIDAACGQLANKN